MVANPEDPLFVKHGFRWIVVPPVIVALRHGFGPGLTSALVLLLLVLFSQTLPSELAYGVILLTMVVGQVSASIRRKTDKLETDYNYLRTQLDGFSRRYALLELSHERLEQRVPSRLTSLRGALQELVENGIPRESAAAFTKMLEVMASYGRVQAASVHLLDAAGRFDATPIASIGAMRAVSGDDLLVKDALDSGEVVYVAQHREAHAPTALVAAIPLLDVNQQRLGVVAIQTLPFTALEASNLRLLHAIAGYAVVSLRTNDDARQGDRWSQFVEQLERAALDARDRGLPSVLVAFWCRKGERGTEVLEDLLSRDLRITDTPILRRDPKDNPAVLVVMPLTDTEGALAFRARIDSLSRERHGVDMAALGVSFQTWLLGGGGAQSATILAELNKMMETHEGAKLALPAK
jgi:hypothetical protein